MAPQPVLPRQPEAEAFLEDSEPMGKTAAAVPSQVGSCLDDLCCALRMQVQTVRHSLSWSVHHHKNVLDTQDNTFGRLLTVIDNFQDTLRDAARSPVVDAARSPVVHFEHTVPRDIVRDVTMDRGASNCQELMMHRIGDWLTRHDHLMRQVLEKQHHLHKATSQLISSQKRPKKNSLVDATKVDNSDSDRRQKAMSVTNADVLTQVRKRDQVQAWRGQLKMLVNSYPFELLFALAITTNAVFLGAEVEIRSRNAGEEMPSAFAAIRHSYNILFFIELLLRATAEGCPDFFCSEAWAWNCLDLVLVALSVFESIYEVVQSADEERGAGRGTGGGMSNLRAIRMFRLTRLIRIVRITRVVRFVRALRTLVHSIACTLKSLVWSMVLLAIIIYVFAIIFTQAVCDFLLEEDVNVTSETVESLRKYWGSLTTSMFTLFKSISAGVSWDEVVRDLDFFWLWPALFTVFICFAYFAVLNVVTGVFCSSAIESAQHDQEMILSAMATNKRQYAKRVMQLFNSIDADRSGRLTIKELEKHLTHPDVQDYFRSLEIEPEDAWTLFKLIDVDDSNVIDLEEFVMGCSRLKGQARSIDMAKLMYDHQCMTNRLNEFMAAILSAVEGGDFESVASSSNHPTPRYSI